MKWPAGALGSIGRLQGGDERVGEKRKNPGRVFHRGSAGRSGEEGTVGEQGEVGELGGVQGAMEDGHAGDPSGGADTARAVNRAAEGA